MRKGKIDRVQINATTHCLGDAQGEEGEEGDGKDEEEGEGEEEGDGEEE